jgi:hypothetical protein
MEVYTSFEGVWCGFSFSVLLSCVCLRGSVLLDDLDSMSLSVLSLYPLPFFLHFHLGNVFVAFPFVLFSFITCHEPKPDGEKSRCTDILTV